MGDSLVVIQKKKKRIVLALYYEYPLNFIILQYFYACVLK